MDQNKKMREMEIDVVERSSSFFIVRFGKVTSALSYIENIHIYLQTTPATLGL